MYSVNVLQVYVCFIQQIQHSQDLYYSVPKSFEWIKDVNILSYDILASYSAQLFDNHK